ncbi:hypothetical protein [uncultured Rhodoblastus sp.]|uniref:hypothetical protein n=1 Tax=uncultured Rhodoblastus sp. TaxID=543037 RepID=UPI0025E7DC63|nr:hypothetical protein [uncultured Rhodoblastus sp.]
MNKTFRASLFAVGMIFSGPVLAADPPSLKEAPLPAPAPGGWRFEATLNGWSPSLQVNSGFAGLPSASSSIGFFTLLRHLYGNVPVSFTARNENFIAGLDLYWVRLGANAHFNVLPGTPFGGVSAGLTLGETILTGFGGIRIPFGAPDFSLYAIAGVRYVNVNESLGLGAPVTGFARNFSVTKNWASPIAGLALRNKFDEKWFADGEVDVGGTGGSATWQFFGALGYNWTPTIASTVGFRALYLYNQQYNDFGGSFRLHQTMLGPQASITYKF